MSLPCHRSSVLSCRREDAIRSATVKLACGEKRGAAGQKQLRRQDADHDERLYADHEYFAVAMHAPADSNERDKFAAMRGQRPQDARWWPGRRPATQVTSFSDSTGRHSWRRDTRPNHGNRIAYVSGLDTAEMRRSSSSSVEPRSMSIAVLMSPCRRIKDATTQETKSLSHRRGDGKSIPNPIHTPG